MIKLGIEPGKEGSRNITEFGDFNFPTGGEFSRENRVHTTTAILLQWTQLQDFELQQCVNTIYRLPEKPKIVFGPRGFFIYF